MADRRKAFTNNSILIGGVKMKKQFIITIVCSLLLVLVVGCNHYRGEYDAFFTETITSLVGVSGDRFDDICVIEHDSYDKTLFTYSANCGFRHYVLAVLISQKADDEYICYYEDCNSIIKEVDSRITPETYDELLEYFSDEDMQALKLQNDWDSPIDEAKTVKEKISDHKDWYPIKKESRQKAFKEFGLKYSDTYEIPLCSDSDGRTIYYVICPDNEQGTEYLFMFEKDGSVNTETGIEELEDLWNYKEQLTRFKEANGWNR